jgi:polysaccharide export outer membrane protein
MVQVSVWRNPELGITAPVRPDGKISVPLVGDVVAGGRTPDEVAKDLQTKLGAYVREPQVTVILTELRSHEYLSRVRVTGAVRQPVSIPYRQGMTVLDAVLAAGGLTEFAAPDHSSLHRKTGNGAQAYGVQLGNILENGDPQHQLQGRPGRRDHRAGARTVNNAYRQPALPGPAAERLPAFAMLSLAARNSAATSCRSPPSSQA